MKATRGILSRFRSRWCGLARQANRLAWLGSGLETRRLGPSRSRRGLKSDRDTPVIAAHRAVAITGAVN
ncbi:hypothetical protein Taro_044151 [Colocasia esculenta]|uniref:Uncharacterized protein n=1 Tax=Colocasia esculenta TaxID=4460 RepID=A0A843X250_COLES|nr:hypothetical protein [Colocasia esculenta]